MDTPQYEPVMNRTNAAAYLDMHPETLAILARKGEIGFVKAPGLRGTYKFKLSHLNEWLSRNERMPE